MTDEAKSDADAKRKEPKRTENWAEDQERRGYYYDDASGYEKYDPKSDGEADETDEVLDDE